MQDEVKVSQADRDAAANLYLALDGGSVDPSDIAYAETVRQGRCDDSAAVQAFARHRHQAERDTLARMEWRDIESAPRDGAVIDLWVRPYTGSAYRACAYWWLESAGVWRTDIRERDIPKKHTPTHWMPLPPAPEAGQ